MKTSWGLVTVAVAAAWFGGDVGCSSSGENHVGGTGGGAGGAAAAGGRSDMGGGAVAGRLGLGGGAAVATGGAPASSGGAAGNTGGVMAGGRGGNVDTAPSSGGTAGPGGRPGAAGAGGAAPGDAGTSGRGGGGAAGKGSVANGTGGAGPTGGAGAAGRGGAAAGGAAGAGGRAPAPDVLILLDRSASMNEMIDGTTCASGDCGPASKWSLVKTALEGALPLYEETLQWSLKVFASSNTSACVVTAGVEIAPGFSNAAAIAARLDALVASTSTPTTAAETAAADYLSSVADGAPKYILLITDGIPTCGIDACAPNGTGQIVNQCDDANAIAAVKAAHDRAGIPTMVVGIGTDLGTGVGTLEQMAMAGGLPRSSSPAYYPVQTTADLMAAIQALAAAAGL